MKVYNENKTQILEYYDLKKGYLKDDTITVHIDEVLPVKEVYHYEVLRSYANGGKDVRKVIDVPAVAGVEEHDEIQAVKVFIPYTEEELNEIHLNDLRAKREPLLTAFDKWEKAVLRGRELDDIEIMVWFRKLLDLSEDAINNVPERIKYYL